MYFFASLCITILNNRLVCLVLNLFAFWSVPKLGSNWSVKIVNATNTSKVINQLANEPRCGSKAISPSHFSTGLLLYIERMSRPKLNPHHIANPTTSDACVKSWRKRENKRTFMNISCATDIRHSTTRYHVVYQSTSWQYFDISTRETCQIFVIFVQEDRKIAPHVDNSVRTSYEVGQFCNANASRVIFAVGMELKLILVLLILSCFPCRYRIGSGVEHAGFSCTIEDD